MDKVTVCISTRRRPDGLMELLQSINTINLPENTELSIVVVENDSQSVSDKVVQEFAAQSRFKTNYYLETNQGISHARNRSVKEAGNCDFVCFVDDDQIVDKNWMAELMKCQREYNCDGVSGATPALFRFDVPEYIVDHHKDIEKPYGEIVKQAATGCLLLRKSLVDKLEGPFDIRLNFTGGEDFFMTSQITKIGGIIRINHKAISHEIIPPGRTTVKYVMKRTIRTANTQLIVRSLTGEKVSKVKILPHILGRLLLGIVVFVPYYLFGKSNKLLGLFKICYSIGGLMFVFGRSNRFYK
ncbi:MAG: glycosyltransferase family 2 protein [Bacteroidales bacterium]|nr:glycosyltransferase family 2 protein [Bacteroidales bacterium]